MNDLMNIGLKAVFGAVLSGLVLNYLHVDYLLAWGSLGGLMLAVLFEPRRCREAVRLGLHLVHVLWRARNVEHVRMRNRPIWAKEYARWSGMENGGIALWWLYALLFALGSSDRAISKLYQQDMWPTGLEWGKFAVLYFTCATLVSLIGVLVFMVMRPRHRLERAEKIGESRCRECVASAKRFVLMWNPVVGPFALAYWTLRGLIAVMLIVKAGAAAAWNHACTNLLLTGLIGGSTGGVVGYFAGENVLVFALVASAVCVSLAYLGRRIQSGRIE